MSGKTDKPQGWRAWRDALVDVAKFMLVAWVLGYALGHGIGVSKGLTAFIAVQVAE